MKKWIRNHPQQMCARSRGARDYAITHGLRTAKYQKQEDKKK